jgi:hypothetical protein
MEARMTARELASLLMQLPPEQLDLPLYIPEAYWSSKVEAVHFDEREKRLYIESEEF